MSTSQELPNDWTLESEKTTHDSQMGRDYTTVFYRQNQTGETVRIFEVLHAKANAWQYEVLRSRGNRSLGSADELATAKEIALTYMTES